MNEFLDALWLVTKIMGCLCLIMFLINLFVSLLKQPIRKNKNKKLNDKFINDVCDKIIESLDKKR